MGECTEQTARRTIDTMRDYYHAPIVYRQNKGWCYDDPDNQYELPGIWFSTQELLGLASLLKIVDDMQSELLNDELSNISSLIDELLKKHGLPIDLFKQRIRILSNQHQVLSTHTLEQVSASLIEQTRLVIHYQAYSGSKTKREVSPLKLIYYQENWYLDAYCHVRQALRSFKVGRIINAQATQTSIVDINKNEAETHYQSSYGIFSGTAKRTAVLQFYGDTARDVATQVWHPEQLGEWNGAGYLLSIPYNDDRELVQNILKYANNVEVMRPAELKKKIINIATKVVGLYAGKRQKF